MSSISVFAQKSITGKVVDASGEPLIGVNVLVKGTTVGTITDVDGQYKIQTSNGNTLTFTYIGYYCCPMKLFKLK